MDDDLFPSGPWTGFYNYTGPEDRHRMDLHLDFMNGRMTMTSGANKRDGSSALNDVLVMPGWSAVAVTPVPASRRASS